MPRIIPLILLLALLPGCDRDNPLAPEDQHLADPWQTVAMPEFLPGDWYDLGRLQLTITADSLVSHWQSWQAERWAIRRVERSGQDQYRLLLFGAVNSYRVVYFRPLEDRAAEVAVSAEVIGYEEEALHRSPGVYSRLTAYHAWREIPLDQRLTGIWFTADQQRLLRLGADSLWLDGAGWKLEKVLEDHLRQVLLIEREGRFIAADYETGLSPRLALSQGEAASAETALELLVGPWQDFTVPGWDLLEYLPLRDGAGWLYSYEAAYEYREEGSSWLKGDARQIWGKLQLRVISTGESADGREYRLESSFLIDSTFTHLRNHDGDELVDTTYTIMNPPGLSREFQLTLERDTLWYESEQGRAYCSARWLCQGSPILLRFFDYPGYALPMLSAGPPGSAGLEMGDFPRYSSYQVAMRHSIGIEQVNTSTETIIGSTAPKLSQRVSVQLIQSEGLGQ